jgi:hypothetical protein
MVRFGRLLAGLRKHFAVDDLFPRPVVVWNRPKPSWLAPLKSRVIRKPRWRAASRKTSAKTKNYIKIFSRNCIFHAFLLFSNNFFRKISLDTLEVFTTGSPLVYELQISFFCSQLLLFILLTVSEFSACKTTWSHILTKSVLLKTNLFFRNTGFYGLPETHVTSQGAPLCSTPREVTWVEGGRKTPFPSEGGSVMTFLYEPAT